MQSSFKAVKFGGRLCLCNRPERLSDVIMAMKDNNIEPKLLRFVSKTPKDAPWLFLIEGRKGGKPF
jgi:tRNA1(Val) A37 N6-methylase TrmN6